MLWICIKCIFMYGQEESAEILDFNVGLFQFIKKGVTDWR